MAAGWLILHVDELIMNAQTIGMVIKGFAMQDEMVWCYIIESKAKVQKF